VVARELLDGLARRRDVDVTAFAISWRGRSRLSTVVPAGVAVRSRPVPARLARPAWERATFPSSRWLAGPTDVVHGPNHVVPPGGGAAEVVTVHDLTAVRFPELATADVRRWPSLLERAIDRGAWIHTVSDAVADEVRDRWPRVADRVVAVPNGFRPPPAPTTTSDGARGRRLAGGDRYVLAVGTVEPRKDLPTLVAAFDLLAAGDRDLRLVLAGPDGWGVDALVAALDRSPHRRRIRRLGWVSDDDRLALLRGASALAYPSRYEGFGLVPLEAMAVGTPVVATRIPAIEEVVGDAALLVPVGDVEALAEDIGRAVDPATDPEAAARSDAARARVDRFDWARTVDGIVDLYRRAGTR
jgi:glycosyltransferase involved in cell wall biosynthesis